MRRGHMRSLSGGYRILCLVLSSSIVRLQNYKEEPVVNE